MSIVASAGLTEQGSVDTLTPEHFDKVFNLNERFMSLHAEAAAADDERRVHHSGRFGDARDRHRGAAWARCNEQQP